ncbi:hypothetical protein [Reyranella soli]|jgi:hypothetical protein|uniref:DUF2946 domain-containing protein n=1 Tax=Reyranella soli TaxID=1230389 RepID=A0A512NE93_9HYPH|nr:hypothetical protein [Reyranella soli]GEP57265.1 hypothetical protein RSO01_44310 [Reyranella soli]
MVRLRSLLWLVALVGFIVPSLGTVSVAKASSSAEHAAVADCLEHAPPPAPCPDKDSAKHAAGTCCPLMTAVPALLLPAAVVEMSFASAALAAPSVPSLAGRIFTKDPPPPRV